MNKQTQLILNLVYPTAGILALCMLAFNVQAKPVTQNYRVKVEVNDTETALVITTPTSELGDCPDVAPGSPAEDGCISVKKNENANINIRLQGNPTCTNGRWVLEGVYLGGYNSAKPTSWGNLNTLVERDFNANRASGKSGREMPDQSNPGRNWQFVDLNPQDGQVLFWTWYKVVAHCVDSGGNVRSGPIETDPRIRNAG